jgi:hypothetical protein
MRAQVGVVAIAAVVHLWTAPLAAAQPYPAKPVGKQVPETAIRSAWKNGPRILTPAMRKRFATCSRPSCVTITAGGAQL